MNDCLHFRKRGLFLEKLRNWVGALVIAYLFLISNSASAEKYFAFDSEKDSISCTDNHNIAIASISFRYFSTVIESIKKGYIGISLVESDFYYKKLKQVHLDWCDCISSNYGYSSHLCENE